MTLIKGYLPGGTLNFKWQGWKPKNIPRAPNKNPQKSLNQKWTPKNPHAEFPSLKIFQKALNDITQKIKTLEIQCLCLFLHHTIWGHPKKYLPNFPFRKNSGIVNFEPPKDPSIFPVTWNPEYHLGVIYIPDTPVNAGYCFFLFEKKGVTISLKSKQLPKNAKSSSGRGASLKSSFWSNLVNIRNLDKSLCKTLVNLCLQLLKILIEKMSWMLCISLHHQTNNWKNIPSLGFLTFKTSCTKIIL